jgi:rhamnogalacturonan endolyase
MQKICTLLLAVLLFGCVSATFADDHKIPRADTSMATDQGDRIVLDNGIVSATIIKSNAHIVSYKYKGYETLKDGYYSMDGGKGYAQPSHCEVSVKTNTNNLVDVAFKSTWQPGYRQQAFDIECHYVIEKGTSGIYCYALLTHQAAYPATRVGEWRYVWKVPGDFFDHIMVDSLRNMELPTQADYAKAEHTSIPESVKLTTGVKAGTYECKYGYSVEYYDVGTYGQASNKYKVGGWAILGGYDFFNDGPSQADLNSAAGTILVHFGRDHYAGSGTSVEAGEQWSKAFGPYLLYLNTGADANVMWADAKKKVVEEKAKWPYRWLTNTPEYPLADGRGTVAGTFVVKDPYKPNVKGGNAWVGLIVPGTDWQKDSKNYQYWVKADASGKFVIPNIRPGTYSLHAYVNGAVGEYAAENITVKARQTQNIGNQTWNIPRDKGKLIWEIGIPDRTAREFKFGKKYWNSFMWETYSPALPNPLVYTVGSSDWHTDWNYVQSAYWNKDGSFSTWPWKINFKLDKLPASGYATLTFAFASVDRGRLTTYVNDESAPFDTFTPTLDVGGNALVRQGIHAKYSTYVLKVPVAKLKVGDNSIMLITNRGSNRTDHIMYDYISMECPQ